jgi:hypothetical protein
MVAIGAVGNGEPTGQPPRIRDIAESGTILTRLKSPSSGAVRRLAIKLSCRV